MPVTIPVVDPIVATPGVVLLHVPPPVLFVSVIVSPTQIGSLLKIGVINAFTLIPVTL